MSYELDYTGISPANLVLNEQHTLTASNSSPHRLIVPIYAPFYLDNFTLVHVDDLGVVTPLNENIDFNFCMPFIGATRSIGKQLYGGISIMNNSLNGQIRIATYQTIGGNWVADPTYVLAKIADMLYNPRIIVWDAVTNVQEIFPPVNHDQNFDYVFGHQDLIDALNNVASAILTGPSNTLSAIKHLTTELNNNPHNVTKNQVELGNVVNLPVATTQQIANRTPAEAYVTLAQVLELFP